MNPKTLALCALAVSVPLALVTAQDPPRPDVRPAAGIPECADLTTTDSGLQFGVLRAGRDEPGPGPKDVVEVHYTGWLTNGTKFDSSRDRGEPTRFAVHQVIAGWREGLQRMTPGAHVKLVIPPQLAYGEQEQAAIPRNSTLVFEVELLKVVPVPKFRPARPDAQQKTESGVAYEVVEVGTGAQCAEGDSVALRYALFTPAGELKDCSEWRNDDRIRGATSLLPFAFLGELAVLSKVGDVLRVEVPKAQFPKLGGDSVWEIELDAVAKMPKFRALDPEKTVTTESGLQYEVIEQGTGEQPTARSTVVANYAGWLVDGKLFDSSFARGQATEFPLNRVIKGWTEGLQKMQVGGTYLFSIPPELGYGSEDKGSIPPNSTLVFLVELVAVK